MRKVGSKAVVVEVQDQPKVGVIVAETTLVHPSLLNPAPYNPRKITPEKMEGLKADIRMFGFVEKVVVQKQSEKYGPMVIIGGHQRVRAVREISIEDNKPLPDLPCTVMDIEDRPAMMLNAALNNARAEYDNGLLAEMLEMIQAETPILPEETLTMGFEEDEVAKILKLAEPPMVGGGEDVPSFGRSVTLGLAFKDVRERDAVKTKLEELAVSQKKTTGEVVLGLLGAKKKR